MAIEKRLLLTRLANCPALNLIEYTYGMPQGLVMEFGVHVGNTLRAISHYTDRPVFGFDSFEGLPEDWSGAGGVKKGHFACDVPENLRHNVVIVKGWFEDTLAPFCKAMNHNKVAFVHIDCDIYSGAKTIFEELTKADMWQDGSVIVFDEIAGYPGWEEGEFKAFNEFLDATGWKWKLLGIHAGDRSNLETGGEVKCAFKIFK